MKGKHMVFILHVCTYMYTCGVSTLYMLFFEVHKLFSLNKIQYELYVILLG